jgi:hypothetical protein
MMAYVMMVLPELKKTKTETFGLQGLTEFAVTMKNVQLFYNKVWVHRQRCLVNFGR